MDESQIRQVVRCCVCRGSLVRSAHINLVALGRRATWDYPTAGNVLTGARAEAVAIVCDECLTGVKQPEFAVEFRDGEPVYHTVGSLERIEATRQCRVCGCTDLQACDVAGVPCCWIEEDLCSACAPMRAVLASEDAGRPWLVQVLVSLAESEIALPVVWTPED
jgi:hypothetical protein